MTKEELWADWVATQNINRFQDLLKDETEEDRYRILEMLLADLEVKAGEELLVIVNGAGATTLMELLILFRRVCQILKAKNIKLARAKVGEFITTQEQAGIQMMIARLDAELTGLWDAPCDTPYFVVR